MPNFALEATFKSPVGGVDEVGRGPWAGPVVAAAVVFLDPSSLPLSLSQGINDSKKLSALKRNAFYHELMALDGCCYGIGMVSVEEIDRLNILKATFLAMERAVNALPERPATLLIDGKFIPSFPGIQTHPVIGGDGISLSIAAASIVAKVTRDALMAELAKDYPVYGWESNAGYGTAHHQQALQTYGITQHHRKSFAPIRKLVDLMSLAG